MPSESGIELAGILGSVLDRVSLGIVVSDHHGVPVLRSHAAEEMLDSWAGGALVAASLRRTMDQAVRDGTSTESVDIVGPPRRAVTVSAWAVDAVPAARIVATIEDVTERRRLEAVRQDFVANVSHELKTPAGALALLAEALEGEVDPEVTSRLVGRIQAESIRLCRMIDDLLDLSRIEEQGATCVDRLAAGAVVARAVERVKPNSEHRRIALEVDDTSPIPISVDSRQLVMALQNLLENAVKYSDEGATVRVGVSLLDDHVRFFVSDDGIGIPATDLPRIFERFYRVDRARARDTGGTGLGLAIVRHVAENHGGRVEVDSREGVGSTFALVVPSRMTAI